MKKIDISKSVMNKVVQFERHRSRRWLRILYIVLATLAVGASAFLWISWDMLTQMQSWDLLSIFWQDKEIIADYWQETVMTFLAEIPTEIVIAAAATICMGIIIIVATRKRRKVMERRVRELAKR
jgi:hypothetical protein